MSDHYKVALLAMWHSPEHAMGRARHRSLILATSALLLLSLLALLTGWASATSSVDTWKGRIAADQASLAKLEQRLDQLTTEIDAAEREFAQMQDRFEARAVTIYKSGGIAGARTVAVVTDADTVGESLERADVARQVAEHDQAELDRVERIAAQIPKLEAEQRSIRRQISAVKREMKAHRAKLRAARKEAAEARRAAAALARTKDVPLQPAVVNPEHVEASLGSTGESDNPASSSASAAGSAPGLSQTGVASMYGSEFTGRPTASGEPYDPGAMTAAHPTLPLGTLVTVRGPGGSAMVRVNDRGPFVGGRIIDLSAAAAGAVGCNGLATVTITVQS